MKKKQCWNCKSELAFRSAQCPFCGVSLSMWNEDEVEEENGDVLYSTEPDPMMQTPNPPYDKDLSPLNQDENWNSKLDDNKNQQESDKNALAKSVLLPLIFFLPGSVFFLFSFMLLLFSQNGELILQWKSSYWIFYLAVSLPLLYLGWRFLRDTSEKEENLKVAPQEQDISSFPPSHKQ